MDDNTKEILEKVIPILANCVSIFGGIAGTFGLWIAWRIRQGQAANSAAIAENTAVTESVKASVQEIKTATVDAPGHVMMYGPKQEEAKDEPTPNP